MFTRYSVATVRSSKNQHTIVDAIMKAWISYFGKPAKFIADNGGEFDNESFKDMCDMLDIEILKTAAYSPWSNGLAERHNGVLKESIKKTMEDTGCSIETATAWSTSAKNSLCNHSGFSANQMVLGRNPNFPSILNNKLPGLSSDDELSYTVEENLKAMQLAREACVKAESAEKIKTAMRNNVPSYNNEIFENGQKVYYKRKDKRWSGPAVVIRNDGKTIIVKRGGEIIRAHISRLIHVKKHNITKEIVDCVNNNTKLDIVDANKNGHTQISYELDSDSESELNTANEPEKEQQEITSEDESHVKKDQKTSSDHDELNDESNKQPIMEKSYPDIKSQIMYKTNENSDWKKGYVVSRAGKVGKDKKGKHKAKYNVRDEETNQISHYDFDKEVCEWMPVSSEVLYTNVDKTAKANAKSIELQNWKDNKVYTEVQDEDQYAITTRWITTTKEVEGNFIVKARLVARGFEDIHNQGKNDSPTCTKDSLRLALTIMASKDWKCMSMDIKTAFLQSFQLEREIFLVPPKEAETDKLWKLNKAVYGLNEASRQWYNRVSHELNKLGMERSKYDEALFYLKSNQELIGITVVHVDDFLFGGTAQFHNSVIKPIEKIFEIGRKCSTPLVFLGLSINQTEGGITMNQDDYINTLEEVKLNDSKNNDRILNKEEHKQYRRLCGSLNWVSTQTRPDISFDVAMITANVSAPTVKNMKLANKVVRNVKSTSYEITFCKLQLPFHLSVYCDASYGNLPNGGSQGGQIIFLSDENGLLSPITWTSKKVRRVCRSTISAETMSMLDAVDSSIWIGHILQEITGYKLRQSKIKTDNESLDDAAHSTTAVEEKRLRVDIAAIREEIRNRTILVDWIPNTEQLADVLTKQGANRIKLINVLKNSHL